MANVIYLYLIYEHINIEPYPWFTGVQICAPEKMITSWKAKQIPRIQNLFKASKERH